MLDRIETAILSTLLIRHNRHRWKGCSHWRAWSPHQEGETHGERDRGRGEEVASQNRGVKHTNVHRHVRAAPYRFSVLHASYAACCAIHSLTRHFNFLFRHSRPSFLLCLATLACVPFLLSMVSAVPLTPVSYSIHSPVWHFTIFRWFAVPLQFFSSCYMCLCPSFYLFSSAFLRHCLSSLTHTRSYLVHVIALLVIHPPHRFIVMYTM